MRWRGAGRPRRMVVLCAAAALAAACSGSRDPRTERERRARSGRGDLVIAAAWPWELRKEIRYGEGLELAAEEVNAAGGIGGRKLRIARFDDRESIDTGRQVAHKIAADPDVVAVVGHLQSYVTIEAAKVYDQAGLPLLMPTATDPGLTSQGHGRVFRATFDDAAVGRQLAEFVAGRGLKRVAVYYIRNGYGRNVANAFESRANDLGLEVLARASYDPSEQASERTFDQVLGEWKLMELEGIVLAGEVPSGAVFLARARAAGITVPVVGGDAMSSPGLISIAGPAAEGAMVAGFFHSDEPRPEGVRFGERFRARYGTTPDAGSALGYDCVRLIAHAMKSAGSAAPDEMARAMRGLRAWPGVTRAFTFDERGELVDRAVVMSVVRGGRFEFLPPAASARAGGGASGR